MNIRIMSSNVWGNCPADRPLADRDDKMAVVYHRYLPDSIGMQECSPKLRAEQVNLFELIKGEYEEIAVTPTNKDENNYTPIVYRRDKLTLEDSGWLCFAGLNDRGSKSITWALFCHKESGERFIHINAHYFWTSDDPGRQARISNSGELLALWEQIAAKYPYPVVVTGDFNCCTDEPPIAAILDAGFVESRFCAEKPVVSLRSYHAYPDIDDSNPEHITYRGHMPSEDIEKSIDHIFVGNGFKVKCYETVVDSEALESSDHCPLYCDLTV